MQKNRTLVLGVIMLALCLCTDVQATDSNLTPLPGSPLRKAVLDALRQEVKRIHGLDVVFVVKHLKVKNGWAWAHTLPQSPGWDQSVRRCVGTSAASRWRLDGSRDSLR